MQYGELMESRDCSTAFQAAWVVPAFRPPKEWPPEGRVDFSNYQTRYRPGLDLVLKGVTAQIKSGEKVQPVEGICASRHFTC